MATTKKRNDTLGGPKKTPTTKSQAPTNPGNPGTPSNEPCVACQKAALSGCDVNTLELIAITEVAVPVFPKKEDANKQQINPNTAATSGPPKPSTANSQQPPPAPQPPPVKKPTDAPEPRKIQALKRLRKKLSDAERKEYPEHIHKHLEDFDIILDCTAGFKDGFLKTAKTSSAPNIQNLSAKATFHRAGKCPTGEHPKMSAKVLAGKAERIDGGSMGTSATIAPWPGGSYIKEQAEVPWPPEGEERRFLADPIFDGKLKESSDFTFLFYLIFAILEHNKPKLIQVVAEGHGKRTDGQEVRQSLLGLYRIFREDQISLVFATKGPGRKTAEEEPEPGAKGTPEATALKQYATTAKSKVTTRDIIEEVKRIATPPPRKGFVEVIKGRKLTEPETSIQLLINDETLTLWDEGRKKQLGELIELRKKLGMPDIKSWFGSGSSQPTKKPAGYENFNGGMATLGLWFALLWELSIQSLKTKLYNILTTLKSCVKYGLWMDLDFAWFDGNIGIKYATKDGKTYPRYKSIVYGFSYYQELSLLNLQLSLKFGVLADFGGLAGIWAYVYVGFAFKVTSSLEVSLDSDNAGTQKSELTSEPELSIGAAGGAKLLGAIVSAVAEARVKLTFKYSVEINNKHESKLETSVVLNPVVLEYRAEAHMVAFPSLDKKSNGQWYPWGAAKRELWSAKVP